MGLWWHDQRSSEYTKQLPSMGLKVHFMDVISSIISQQGSKKGLQLHSPCLSCTQALSHDPLLIPWLDWSFSFQTDNHAWLAGSPGFVEASTVLLAAALCPGSAQAGRAVDPAHMRKAVRPVPAVPAPIAVPAVPAVDG